MDDTVKNDKLDEQINDNINYAFYSNHIYQVGNSDDSYDQYFHENQLLSTSQSSQMAPRVKRKRIVLSLKQKIDIINRLTEGEKASHIAKEYNVGTSSIADIKMKKDSILKYVSTFGSEDAMNKRKTMKNPINKELDDAVHDWYKERRKSGQPVSGQQLCDKALELNNVFHGSPDFKASSGWLKNFKSRHGLDSSNMQDVYQTVSNSISQKCRSNFEVSNDTLTIKSHHPKRKRVVLSLKQKIDIIHKLREGASTLQLAREYNIGTSSVTDIKMKQADILRYVARFESMEVMAKRKTMKPAYNKELDRAVYDWYLEEQYSGKSLSGPTICDKALELNNSMGGSSDFKASNGWLQNFKSRHGLDFKLTEGKQEDFYPSSPEDWTLKVFPDGDNFSESNAMVDVSEVGIESFPERKVSNNVDYNALLSSFDSVIQWVEEEDHNSENFADLIKLRNLAYKKAMSVAFSSEESEPINRTIESQNHDARDASISLEDMYEIDRCMQWITNHQFTKIALQFPDNLLSDAASIALKLEDLTEKQVFILGDTSYGSCCVDEVAAEHVSADAIIHFGHSCLSPTKRLPVLYIFGRHVIDICDAATSFQRLFPDKTCSVAILYEVMYSHAIGAFVEQLSEYENIVLSELEFPGEDSKLFKQNESGNKLLRVTKNHRHYYIPESLTINDYQIFYIGSHDVILTNFMLTFPNNKFYSYNPVQKNSKAETLDANKHLKKRYYYIEKAKDANIIGILVGTLGVSNYLTTINHLKELIKNAGKKSYTLVVGKLNNAKLANFSEIEVFVNVACIESSLIDTKEFYQPIVTPFELEVSLNQAREWTGDYITDFSEILPGAAGYVPFENNINNSDVSLITGKIRNNRPPSNKTEDEFSETAVVTRNNMEISTLHSRGAGEFLLQRSWKGLEQQLGETPIAKIEEGQRGIASLYEDEKNL